MKTLLKSFATAAALAFILPAATVAALADDSGYQLTTNAPQKGSNSLQVKLHVDAACTDVTFDRSTLDFGNAQAANGDWGSYYTTQYNFNVTPVCSAQANYRIFFTDKNGDCKLHGQNAGDYGVYYHLFDTAGNDMLNCTNNIAQFAGGQGGRFYQGTGNTPVTFHAGHDPANQHSTVGEYTDTVYASIYF